MSVQPVDGEILLPLVPLDDALDAGYAEWVVTRGTALGADTVILDVADAPPSEHPDPSC